MQPTQRLPAIALLGAVAVFGAAAYRGHVLAMRRQAVAAAPIAATPMLTNPRMSPDQEASLRATVKAHPSNHNARWELVNFYMEAGQARQAATQLDVLTRLGSQSSAESLALANVRLLLKQYPQAEAMYRNTVRQQPGRTEAWQGLATTLFRQQHYLEAMQTARRALTLAPNDPGTHLVLGSSALAYGLQFGNNHTHHEALDLARAEFQNLTKSLPDSADVYFQLGRADIMLQRPAEAILALRRSLELTATADGYRQLATAEKDTSDTAAARSAVEEGLAHFPNDATLHDLRGQLLQTDAGPSAADQALAEFRKAAALQSTNPYFRQREGAALLRAGRLAEARQAFEAAARLGPELTFPYQQLAVVYTRLGDPTRARAADKVAAGMAFNSQQLKQIQALTLVHPDSVPLRLILADRYRDLKMTAAARDEYLLVQQLDPGNVRARKGLAAIKSAPSVTALLPH